MFAVRLRWHAPLFTCNYKIPEVSLKLHLLVFAVPFERLLSQEHRCLHLGFLSLNLGCPSQAPGSPQPAWGSRGRRAPMLLAEGSRGRLQPSPRAEGVGRHGGERMGPARLLGRPGKWVREKPRREKLLTSPFPVRTNQHQTS